MGFQSHVGPVELGMYLTSGSMKRKSEIGLQTE